MLTPFETKPPVLTGGFVRSAPRLPASARHETVHSLSEPPGARPFQDLPDTRLPGRSSWLDCATAATTVLLCRLLSVIPCHLYDDAFITFRIAENFAAGRGFVYNPGAPWEPVLGTTTPAFACILAAAAALGLDLTWFSVLFNAVCDAVTAIVILRCFGGDRRLSGWLAVLAFAFMPELSRNSAGGMECSFFVMVVLLANSLGASRYLFSAGLLAVIAPMVRPEGVLVLPIVACLWVRSASAVFRLLAPALMLGVTYVALLTWYFGSPIPNSLLAKADLYAGSGGWQRLREILIGSVAPSWPMLAALPFVMFGCWRCLRSGGPMRAYSVFALLVTAAYLAARPMMFGWYYQPILTADCLWLGLGLAGVLQILAPSVCALYEHRRRTLSIVSAGLVIAGVSAAAYVMGPSRIRGELYKSMQTWAEQSATASTTILACDIGCIGYVSNARILDTGGLVWPEARRRTKEPDLMVEFRPDYALIIASPGRVKIMQTDPDLVRLYVPVERFNVGDDRRLIFSEADLSDEARRHWAANWRHDYILYARRDLPIVSDRVAEPAIH
jgi:hypothetical protein